MKTLNAPDTISGKEGRAYAKIDGNKMCIRDSP